jgi:hypothetical protein
MIDNSIIGKYGRLLVTGLCHKIGKCIHVECICECGCLRWIRKTRVMNGVTKSCGCLVADLSKAREFKHGLMGHDLYGVWRGMIQRCTNPKNRGYGSYGGRGVFVCEEWRNDFMAFYNWSMANGYEKGLSLDKDKNAPTQTGLEYSPKYCSYITQAEQNRHQSTNRRIEYNGVVKNLTDWCRDLKISYPAIMDRLKNGMSVVAAFETPVLKYKK